MRARNISVFGMVLMVTACVQTQEITSAAVDVKMSRAGAEQPVVG